MKPRKEVSLAQRRLIIDAYAEGVGFEELAAKHGHCVSVIRRVLVESNIPIRHRGRPRNAE
jgi:hypothetical protein